MELNIFCDLNLKEEITNICKNIAIPSSQGMKFQIEMNNFLNEKNRSGNYVALFTCKCSDICIVTNKGIVEFFGDQPFVENMSPNDKNYLLQELDRKDNFKGELSKYYCKYEEFIKGFAFNDTDEAIQLKMEDEFRDFMRELFDEIGNRSEISIDLFKD